MGIGTGGAAAIGAGVSAAAGLGGAALQSNAAGNAAGVQAQAAEEAAQLQYQEAQQALGFEEQQYKNTLGLEEPQYLSGISGLSTLDQLLGLPGQSPDMSVFNDPLGSLQQPGSSTAGQTASYLNTPQGEIPLPELGATNSTTGTVGGQSFTPMQAYSAQANVPLSALGGTQSNPVSTYLPSQTTQGPVTMSLPQGSTAAGSGATPAQMAQAAQIEGFAPAGNATSGIGQTLVPLSSLGATATNMSDLLAGANRGIGASGGPVTYQGSGGPISFNGPGGTTIGTGTLPGTTGGSILTNPGASSSAAGGASGTVPGTSLPAGYLSETWNTPFVAPTAQQAEQMPGYQFQLQQGEQAIQNSAAATGGLLSGGTAKALDQYSQGLASTDYQNLYNQALTQYQQAYNIFNQNQANVFNRYASLAGIGQTSAQQLSNAGLSTGSNVGNTLLTAGSQIGQQLNNVGAAQASGYIGSANAYGGAISSLGNLGQLASLASLLGGSSGSAGSQTIYSSSPSGAYG